MLLAFCQMLCAGTTLPRPHGLFLVLNYNLLSHHHVSFLLLRRYLGMDEPSSHCSLATFMHAKVFLFHPVQYIYVGLRQQMSIYCQATVVTLPDLS